MSRSFLALSVLLAATCLVVGCSVVNAPDPPVADGTGAAGATSPAGGSGGTGGADSCMQPEVDCGGACANTMTDPAHCGGCGKACMQAEFCVNAQCRADCGTLLQCGNACADILVDPIHCGGCNNACGTMAVCTGGNCVPCASSELICNNVCADVSSDDMNCGGCGVPCTSPEVCIASSCGPAVYQDCAALKAASPSAPDGIYSIDPDGQGGVAAFDAYCDMTTDGGGWTLVYYVDAAFFDGVYSNDFVANMTAPTAVNSERDMWNAELVMTINETLVACTTQNDQNTFYWRYGNADPHTYWSDPNTTYDYQQAVPSVGSNTTAAGCVSSQKSTSTGFMMTAASSCGSCNAILWGMYHYPGSPGCNSTDTTYGAHASPHDNRSIQYPICNLQQTSNGKFWIGVR